MTTRLLTFVKLIRPLNLLIIGGLMYIIRWGITAPFHKAIHTTFFLPEWAFLMICLSTLLIAAAGYIINDYFDQKIDAINKPNQQIVGVKIPPKTVIVLYTVYSLLGLAIGSYIAFSFQLYSLVVFQSFAILSLWLYSYYLKKTILLGNIIIAILAALVPIIAGIYELNILLFYTTGAIIACFSIFSFLLTMIRELIKDAEDIQGDQLDKCQTFPIKYGLIQTNWLIIFIILITLISLVYIEYLALFYDSWATFMYVLLALQIPLIYLALSIKKANSQKSYQRNSTLAKIIMLLGITYGGIFPFIF